MEIFGPSPLRGEEPVLPIPKGQIRVPPTDRFGSKGLRVHRPRNKYRGPGYNGESKGDYESLVIERVIRNRKKSL